MKKAVLAMICCLLFCSCSHLVRAEQKDIVTNDDQVFVDQMVKMSESFSPGDIVVYVLRINFDKTIPVLFYPGKCPEGEVVKINDDGYVIVKWGNKEKAVTISNPFFLAKLNKKDVPENK